MCSVNDALTIISTTKKARMAVAFNRRPNAEGLANPGSTRLTTSTSLHPTSFPSSKYLHLPHLVCFQRCGYILLALASWKNSSFNVKLSLTTASAYPESILLPLPEFRLFLPATSHIQSSKSRPATYGRGPARRFLVSPGHQFLNPDRLDWSSGPETTFGTALDWPFGGF
jgi:hypothetical protein